MQLSSLLAQVHVVHKRTQGTADPYVTQVVDDSRLVSPGSLFVARRGEAVSGASFIQAAVERGAVAVMVEEGTVVDQKSLGTAVLIEAPQVSRALASLAEAALGKPASQLQLVGITGTNGKTTTATIYRHILRESARRCGLLGTVEVDDGVESRPARLTTPGSVELSAALARMVKNGCVSAVMEVSSHALVQDRVSALEFACAVFTNLSGDHLDFHGDMAAYADAKAMLFATLAHGATAVVNADDPASDRMLRDCQARRMLCRIEGAKTATGADASSHRATAGAEAEGTVCSARIISTELGSMRCLLQGPWGEMEVRLPMVGAHNAMNVLQAAAAAFSTGVSPASIAAALQSCAAPPGRLEPVTKSGDSFCILVDYAHTDDALRNVLQALRPVVGPCGRLSVLFGCGGDRDKTKRPRMARAACDLADAVWVTSDNPRTEDARVIIEEILSGVSDQWSPKVRVEVDRARAIGAAVADAREGDILLIAGKGHEDYQIIGTQKFPFDDRKHAAEALALRSLEAVR
ncbi:MAG: UDP-N-acetylmuramoyl-L-alanyl-D-glutamate--2,6-diaminopimelate ligase [Phycisphaerales bacterium]|nr:UDP-N-acetylmuramoyl-L-alanyl-D-glutamate--2,6-diaminopimelate ligase [Phycisphaerales bacterium]